MLYELIMDRKPARSWFALLRRDGRLFAVIATLLLVLNALPATHVSAEASGIICTIDGAIGSSEQPETAPACPLCLVSASCFGGLAALGPEPIDAKRPSLPGGEPMPSRWDATPLAAAPVGTDSIRGPPFA